MTAFTTDWLRKQGLSASEAELAELVDILEDEMEVRVGMDIADHLTDVQISEFETIFEQTAVEDLDRVRIAWLTKNYPDYDKSLRAQQVKLSRQVRTATDKPVFIRALLEES